MNRSFALCVLLLGVTGCDCVKIPEGHYRCDEATGADCDGGLDGGPQGDGGPGFPAQLCIDTWCWDNPRPYGRATMRSVLEVAPNDVWVGGQYGNLFHFDGARWQQVPTGTAATINRLWSMDRSSVWAVGGNGTVLEWTGGHLLTHDAGVNSDLRGLSGTAARDVFVVGAGNQVLRFNGVSWSKPLVPMNTGALFGVATWPGGRGLALGDFGIKLDNGTWSSAPKPLGAGQLVNLWAPTPNEVWASGAGGGLYRNITGAFDTPDGWEAFDAGTALQVNGLWSLSPSHVFWGAMNGFWESTAPQQLSPRGVFAIHGLAPDDIWAVGVGTIQHRRIADSFFDELLPPAGPEVQLQAAALLPGGFAWAVGEQSVVLARDGGTWSRVRLEDDASGGTFFDLWTMPGAPVIVVGTSPMEAGYWDAGAKEMSELHGLQNPGDLWGVWGSAADDIWIVGQQAFITHFDGTAWTPKPTQFCSGTNFEDAWGTGRDDVWVVGEHSCVLHWTGSQFVDESLTSDEDILAAAGLPTGEVWICTWGGQIYRRTGTAQWVSELSTNALHTIAEFEGRIYAVGDQATVLRRAVASPQWSRMVVPIDPNTELQKIIGTPGEGMLAVGSNSIVIYKK